MNVHLLLTRYALLRLNGEISKILAMHRWRLWPVLCLLSACAYVPPPHEPFIAQKAGVSQDQMQQDMAQCAYEVRLHVSPEYAVLPDHMYYRYADSLEAQCLRGKGYKVHIGKETARIVDCHLPDGTIKAMSILACTDANGRVER
jgi:hypothetical protein